MYRVKLYGVASLFGLSVLLAGIVANGPVTASPKGARWGANYFPNLPVVTQDGKTLRFYDDLIKDKKVVISFIYTSCPDICGLTTARLAQVQERLGDLVGTEVYFYSISLDPENDTPAALKAFADAFQAGPGWFFLTGRTEDLHRIRYKLGERSRSLSEHRNFVVLGNDRTGEWSRASIMANLGLLVSQIRELDPKWLARKRPPPPVNLKKNHRYRLTNRPGEALFLKACASCHSFAGGDVVGPDLAGVTERRDEDWLIRFMMNPDVMRKRKDPLALALDAKYKGVRMPNLSLNEPDAKDLIAYFKLRTRESGERAEARKPHNHADHSHEQRTGG